MVTSTSACNTNLSKNSSFGNRSNLHNLHETSFSSYLNHAEQKNFLHKLTGSSPNLTSFISSPQKHAYAVKKKVEDEEIGVFGAEKYFKGAMDVKNPKISRKSNTKHDHDHEKDEPIDKSSASPKTHPATPSVHSESSLNSKSAFLYKVPRNQTRANKGNGKCFLANLGCNCYCNDKNSVEVDDGHIDDNSGGVHGKGISKQPEKTGDLVQPNKSLSKTWAEEEMHMHSEKFHEKEIGSKREECFSFPILNSKPGDTTVEVKLNKEDDNPTRNSLEVFGSPILEKGNKSSRLDNKLTMLNWGKRIARPPNELYNDTESDASSDLFEIESFSTNPNCYAPSEASIEWSVVTASAADFSMMSDSEELRTAESGRKIRSRMEKSGKSSTKEKEMQKRRTGILLGCKSQKSVRVAEDVHSKKEKATHGSNKLELFKPITRFQTENRLIGFDSRHGQ
ncbi:hypothetical protein LguiA_032642 [Lonicera macranthoides]